MKELDELREWVTYKSTLSNCPEEYTLARLDVIEQAIADRYMELPVDADGVPWHIGDCTESGDSVRAIGYKTIVYDFDENDCDWAHMRTHEKPDTVEDALRDFIEEFNLCSVADARDVFGKYVERIERLVK